MVNQLFNEPVNCNYLMNPAYVGKDGKDYATTTDLLQANRKWSELRFQKIQQHSCMCQDKGGIQND